MAANIVFRQLTPQDEKHFPAGLELLNRTQGRDLFPPNYLDIRTNDKNSRVFVAMKNDEIVSLGIAQLIFEYSYYYQFAPNIDQEFKGKTVGSFSTLCTLESLQGQGLGKRISQMRVDWLKEQKCDVIVGVSWISGKTHTSDRVFEKMNFKKIKKVDKFFEKQSIDHPFDCPGCKEKPCSCAAAFYVLELN